MSDNFNSDLQAHLWKCELEFTADRYPHGHCIDWLSEMCTSTKSIEQFLRSIGFKIKEVPIIFVNRVLGSSKMNTSIFGEAFFGVIKLKLRSIFGKIHRNVQ